MSITLSEISSFVADKDEDTEPLDAELDIQEQQQQTFFDLSEVEEVVKIASEGALANKTVKIYRRYYHNIISYY